MRAALPGLGLALLTTAACATSAPTLPQAEYCLTDGETVLVSLVA